MADVKISELKTKKYINPIEDGVLIPASVLEGGKYVSGAIDTTDMAEYVAKSLDKRYDLKGSGVSVNNVRPGNGISVVAHEDGGVVISNTLTHSLYEVVETLPETGETDKIYVVPASNKGEKNSFIEYGFINGEWEKLGEHSTTVTLPDNLATTKYVDDEIAKIKPYDDTSIKTRLNDLEVESAKHLTADDIKGKVDAVEGKGLSTNDFTTAEKTKLANIEAGAQKNTVLSVNGEVGAVTGLAKSSDIPTKVSQLTNDSGFLTEHQDISGKVDVVEGKGLSTNDFTTELKNKLVALPADADKSPVTSVNGKTGAVTLAIPTKYSDLTADVVYLTEHQDISGKVDVVEGKGLSTNDFTTEEKEKLAGIADGADVSPVKSVNGKTGVVVIDVPTKTSQLTNDSNFLTAHQSLTEYDKAAVADTKYLKVDDYTVDGEFILVKKSDLTTITDRIAALEAKLAKYDERFGYPTAADGDWTKSFLLID